MTKIALDTAGNLWMLDNGSDSASGSRVRKVDALTNIITTEIGGGGIKATSERVSVKDANLFVNGLAIDSAGNVYLADTINHRVWKAGLAA